MKKAILKIGYECNNNCLFCHARTKKKIPRKTQKEMLAKINKIKNRVDCIIFSGGEPLLNKEFLSLAEFTKKKGLNIGIITNARLLSLPKAKEKIKNLNLFCAYTTLHSNKKENHEKINQVPDSFEQTVKGINNLSTLVPGMMANIVIINQNINTLKETVRLLIGMGINNLKLSFVEPITEKDIPHTPKINEAAKKAKETIDSFPGTDIGWDGFPLCLMKGYENKIKNLKTCNIKYISEAWEDDFFPTDCGNKIKLNQCKGCLRENKCEGIYDMYLKFKKFNPIPYKGLHH